LFENQTTQSEKTIRQEAREHFELVELNDQQLDMVAGGAFDTYMQFLDAYGKEVPPGEK
jgi:hypothetical protein